MPQWEALPLTDAAQKVQLSGAPTAYAQWESEARTLAIAFTGEAEAGLTCRFTLDRSADPVPAVTPGLGNELGVTSLAPAFPARQGWTVASWLVAHAQQLRITTVSFRGREWRASTGRWKPTTPVDDHIRVTQQPPTT